MIIDTHSHLNFNAFKDDVEKVIERCQNSDIWMINVGSQYETSKRAVELAEKYESGVYSAVGMHPIHVETGVLKAKMDNEEILAEKEKEILFDEEKYKELARSKKVVAIGEIGLDYYYRPKTKAKQNIFKEKQKEIFIRQLNLAKKLDLPVILHCRMAHNDMIDAISKLSGYRASGQRGVIHCFTGTAEEAEKYLKMGFYIGLNGIIFKLNLDEVIKRLPLDRILLETDCPYLTPPEAPVRRNEPIFIKYVVQKIAGLKRLGYDEMVHSANKNARELFRI